MTPSPAPLSPEIVAALDAAFTGRAVVDLSPLSGGLSRSLIFSCKVDGVAYVVRKSANLDPASRARAIACQRLASDLGVTPILRYADERTGVTIVDRVDAAQMGPTTRGDPALVGKVASTMWRLHGGSPFPEGPTAMDILRRLDQAHRSLVSKGLPSELMDALSDLGTRKALDAQAPCHYDLNPNNILVTPERVYLIDWDTAQQGDPFFDLAQLGVFTFPAPEQREALLEHYLGRPADDLDRARLFVARVRALGMYAAAFFLVHAQVHRSPARAESAMDLPHLLAALGRAPEQTDPGVIGASLLKEVRRERDTEVFVQALERIAVSC